MTAAPEWLTQVRAEERRGELLAAVDTARRGLEQHPEDLRLRHRVVLGLARAGATVEASERFFEYGLDREPDEDVAALRARIAKDRALGTHGERRQRRARRAAVLYDAAFAIGHGFFPAINAATLLLVAGEPDRARLRAERVLAILAATGEESYFAAATEAEAHLLLGDAASAARAVLRAARLGDDHAALASTRRQLRLICELTGIDPGLLGPLTGPGVACFCGHIVAVQGVQGRFPAEAQARVAARMAEVIGHHPVTDAYGALAAGADIMWAEALLATGCNLHVLLPFAREEFIERSVAYAGSGWVDRFDRAIAAAADVVYATSDAFLGDDVLFRYGSELAMGQALLRAEHLDSEVWQFAVWDGEPAVTAAGTAVDIGTWQRSGHCTTVVFPDGASLELTGTPDAPHGLGERLIPATPHPPGRADDRSVDGSQRSGSGVHGGRVVRAMLFGDVRGYSKLNDEQQPAFSEHVLGAIARVTDHYRADIEHANTWGDAVYLVLSDVGAAAECALALQEEIAEVDLARAGLPAHLALRLGGHVGPVFPAIDPILKTSGFIGSHVSRTARIEPVTPPGAVYVTEAFAAAMILGGHHQLNGDYVGHMAAAKGYGNLRMYRLRRAEIGDEPVSRTVAGTSPR